eukprot:scaffold203753_cov28-Tisochrysis_lutea.AAC.3
MALTHRPAPTLTWYRLALSTRPRCVSGTPLLTAPHCPQPPREPAPSRTAGRAHCPRRRCVGRLAYDHHRMHGRGPT